jgi:type I restriction enzyme R subunit
MSSEYTEDLLVERPAMELFKSLGWRIFNAYQEELAGAGETGDLGRESRSEVVLPDVLLQKLKQLNPSIPSEQLLLVIKEFQKDRSSMHPIRANKEIYDAIKEGVDVEFRKADGSLTHETVQIIDWRTPENNDFLAINQLWVAGEYGRKRPDIVCFVNGLPLLLFELKKPARRVQEAFTDNISDYKSTIPQLFWFNQYIFLSNGADSKIGTLSSPWEFFTEWKKISDEEEAGIVSLETAIRGMCEKNRLLDLMEHFLLFEHVASKPKKLMARNHQFLGVNNAIEAVKRIEENKGRLGVFWHTQGSGKSYSMVLLTRKIMRALPGDWKFVIVTDRLDLDEQIYKNFAGVGAVTEPENEVRASSKEKLQQLLGENHRYIFTLIHKFHARDGEEFPVLSTDNNIIVITDEAHRSQYDGLAMNMRKALSNAAFLGFTGTPLIKGEDERTKEVFGDYVSVYDFKQSIEDNATVPLYYENRIPELELTNVLLNEQLQEVLENALLSDKDEEKLEREFKQEYHLITRKDRLETIAKDMVQHFVNRGFLGKGMMVCIDRFTTVRMYDLIQAEWLAEIDRVKTAIQGAESHEVNELLEKLSFMETTEMAVVISKSQNEIKEFEEKGLGIRDHRKRLESENLDDRFKDDDDPLRIVFVCAMWITGFSVSSLSTLYLDKPMKSHTLMQTIARANRVFEGKQSGLIVDYAGVFRHLQQALAVYATGSEGKEGDAPVKNKEELVAELEQAVDAATAYCKEQGVDLDLIIGAKGFEKVKYQQEFAKLLIDFNDLDDKVQGAANQVLMNETKKKEFLAHARLVNQLYKAVLPDPLAEKFTPVRAALKAIADFIKTLTPEGISNLGEVREEIEEKLDSSIEPKEYQIGGGFEIIDLSNIDFDKLKERFEKKKNKRVEVQRAIGVIEERLEKMIAQNRTRMNFKEEFEAMIEKYNNYSVTAEIQIEELFKFVQSLDEEATRHIREQLDEEQLALFDIVIQRDRIELTNKERDQIKAGVKELLDVLKAEKLVLDWSKVQSRVADVKVTIEAGLDKFLPEKYDRALYAHTCNEVFDYVRQKY